MIRRMDFTEPLSPPWRITEFGNGLVTQSSGVLRLDVPPTPDNIYSDAQITDYIEHRDFVWRPPVLLTVTAHVEVSDSSSPFSQENVLSAQSSVLSPQPFPQGTAGFGFWNHPFSPGERSLRLPGAVWFFFSSPPSNMQLALDVPGPGWKAATLDATRLQFLALAPTAPVGFLLMRIPALYRRLWPVGQRAVGVSEHLLDTSLLFERHTYTLDWQAESITFAVDGATVHKTPSAPRAAMGFVAWIDNQYAVVTPKGQFGWGLLPVERNQALILEEIVIKKGTA